MLQVNGKAVAAGKFEHVVPTIYSFTETLDVGEDSGTTVSNAYASPNRFTGEMGAVNIALTK